MYACAKFVTSPAVVSGLNVVPAISVEGLHTSMTSLLNAVVGERNSDAVSCTESLFQHLYPQGHCYDWQPYLSQWLYWHLCQLTVHQSGISLVRLYIFVIKGTNH